MVTEFDHHPMALIKFVWQLKGFQLPHPCGDRNVFGRHLHVATERFLVTIVVWRLNLVAIHNIN
jgi:hypothetical protein